MDLTPQEQGKNIYSPESREAMRAEIARLTNEYLRNGGEIRQTPIIKRNRAKCDKPLGINKTKVISCI